MAGHNRGPGLLTALLGIALSGCYAGVSDFEGGANDGADAGQDSPGDEGGEDAGDDSGDDGGTQVDCSAPSVGVAPLRRLTRFEYDNTVRDLMGDSTRPAHHNFSPDEHNGGYAANGVAPISKTQLDQYAAAAEELSATFVEEGLGQWIDCPASDSACVADFVADFGRRAFRRPLEAAELDEYVALYEQGKSEWDGVTGVRLLVQAILLSPNFLYHIETMADGAAGDVSALDTYALASRTSYFLWASMPDEALLAAADSGELATPEGLEAQVRRMLEDDRAADTIASFHLQWMHLESLPDKVKDDELYPAWNDELAAAMEDETLAFADEVIRRGDGSLQTLLTAPWTIGDAQLAEIYGVAAPEGGYGRIELPEDERAGLLTHASFLTTNAHAIEGSWVHRGMFIRENVLCQPFPPPPPGVEVNEPNDSGRLENPDCSGCHLLMDPIGWGFDDYDALGNYADAGSSGEVKGIEDIGEFQGVVDLSNKLAQSEVVHDCMATQWFRYAARRQETTADSCALDDIKATFAESGQDVRELIVAVALSEAFRYQASAE